ncbi:hypothetical protein HanHA300_Chr05g0164901 [Helianthus annuus]|nr:hypothetical protein HanHA300_Chr05g0164901 [Helianthus annuus]KAJ0583640.1 hypothetical protein HanHA89_Chr05g0178961 [Helianthus annuus]
MNWRRDYGGMRNDQKNQVDTKAKAKAPQAVPEKMRYNGGHYNHAHQTNAWFPKKKTPEQAQENVTKTSKEPTIATGIREIKVPEDTLEIKLQESEISRKWKGRSIIGDVKNPNDLKDIQSLLELDGISGVSTKYVGGLRILLILKNALDEENFVKLKKGKWSTWFSSLYRWEGQNLSFQRLALITIRDVPLQFWGSDIFNPIGNLFWEGHNSL